MKNKLLITVVLAGVLLAFLFTTCTTGNAGGASVPEGIGGVKQITFSLLEGEFFDDFNNGTLGGWTASRSNEDPKNPLPSIYNEGGERGNVVNFEPMSMMSGWTSSITRTVNTSEPMAFSFLVRPDFRDDYCSLVLYINNEKKASYNGNLAMWIEEGLIVPAGQNTITFTLEKTDSREPPGGYTNTFRLDNISFIADETASVILYPRVNLNTYLGASEDEKIRFSAEAFRKDGSLRKEAAGFVFSGEGVNPSTGIFTPVQAGNASVSVSHDGINAKNNASITIHPENYLRLPYTYPATGLTYNGYQGTEGALTTGGGVTVTHPVETIIYADGFVTIEGIVNNPQWGNYATIGVFKRSPGCTDDSYLVQGNFKERIWLRSGTGEYMLVVQGVSGIYFTEGGSVIGQPRTAAGQLQFRIFNTRDDGISVDGVTPDRRFIYPTSNAQSDDFRIINLVSEITYGLTDDTDKIKAIYDYVRYHVSYDYAIRKKQDSISVLESGLAVCEGFSFLFMSLTRAAGFETRFVASFSLNHGWNHVYVNGGWKLFDVTNGIYMLDDLNGIKGMHISEDTQVLNTE